MKIHEYQAKEILKKYDVPTPVGFVTEKLSDVKGLVKKLPTKVSVIKAQIHAGGRGKGGGVKVAKIGGNSIYFFKSKALKVDDMIWQI